MTCMKRITARLFWTSSWAAVVAACLVSSRADARLFELTVEPEEDPAFSVSGQSLIDLTENLLRAQDKFAALEGQEWRAAVRYFAVPGALEVESNASRTDVWLRSPLTGLEQRFQGGSAREVEEAMTDWFKAEGAAQMAELDQAIRRQSAVALSDGNPNAATALLATSAFRTFAMGGVTSGIEYSFGQFSVDTPAGTMDGDQHKLILKPSFRIGDRFAVLWDIPIDHTEIEGTGIYGIGSNLGLRVNLLKPSEERRAAWSLAPFAGAMGRASEDAATGALVWHYGGTSRFNFALTRNIQLTIGNQVSVFDDIPVTYDDYEFELDISQTIVKNGVGVAFFPRDRIAVDALLVHTHFLDEAAIDNYWSAGGGLRYRFGDGGGTAGVVATYDFASEYNGWSLGLAVGRSW